jgi:hypothetical protein
MQFERSAAAPELYTAKDAGPSPGAILYLLPQGTTGPPATIALIDSWDAWSGTYLFLATPLVTGTEAAFAAAAGAYLADRRMAGVRFVWFDPPELPGLLAGTPIAVYQPAGKDQIATAFAATLSFASLSLVIPTGSLVAIDATAAAFSFTSATAPIHLTANWSETIVDTLGPELVLPFTGPFAGCLQFSLQPTLQNLADLDVGLRYFYAVPLDRQASPASAADFFLGSLRYPIFAEGLTLYAALDPLAPLEPARSLFAFSPADAGHPPGPAAAAVASCYRTTLGDAFSLQPLTGRQAFAALVFAANPKAATANDPPPSTAGPRDGLYLVPSGDFALLTGRTANIELMCGLSGVEYVALASSSHIISFSPGCAAFAPGFSLDQPAGQASFRIARPPTTSFAALRAPDSPSTDAPLGYYAQPDKSVLFNYLGGTGGSATMLAPVPVLAATIDDASPPIPLLPYAGLSGEDLNAYARMEAQIVSPRRRSLLPAPTVSPRARPATSPRQSHYSTTPQGLLATYADSSTWDEIVLGQTGNAQKFRLTQVDGDLLAAFQRNKLFLVISDPKAIAQYLKGVDAQIELGSDPTEPWNFDLDPAKLAPDGVQPAWTHLGTILIVKSYDMSIDHLAGQTGTWAAGLFNAGDSGVEAVSSRIANVIKDAQARYTAGDLDFEAFVNAVSDPSWNGILVLNADAPISNLPPQLAGLAAGIDQNLFFGHHIGIALSKIDASHPEALDIHNSSVFGLIHYQAPASLQPGLGDFAFQVQELKVRFQASDVAGLSALIELEVNTLFGEPATLQTTDQNGKPVAAATNIVQLYGIYQRQVVAQVVHGSFTFETQSGDAFTFAMASPTLNAVQFAKGRFVTVTQPWMVAPTGAVRANHVATITTTQPHALAAGDFVTLSGVDDDTFDGLFQVTSVAPSTPPLTQFTYAQPDEPDATSGNGMARPTKTNSRFVFWGLIDFAALDGFDIFSFGREAGSTTPAGLGFGNLVVEMTFDSAADPPVPQFDFDVSNLSFDLAVSTARAASLFTHFPLTVAGFTQAKAGSAPTDLGFMGVQTPLNQASLSYPWFSLNFNLNLGSPGALAAKTGFVATLTAAWSPLQGGTTTPYRVFTGLKLPGSSGASREIALQGIFHITFNTLEILVPPDGASTFILVLYNIGFKFLSFTFPPTGQVNFVLFGNPGTPSGNSSLGWYAAYAKPGSGGGSGSGNSGNLKLVKLEPPRAILAPPVGEA